jgi:mono/diheme cytochrome c family protein
MQRGWLLITAFVAACSSGRASPPDDGEETFKNICARCHGQTGSGGLPLTPGGPAPRDLGDPAWQASKSDAELEATIRDGKIPMPAFSAVLTKDQIRGVVGKVRRLRRN